MSSLERSNIDFHSLPARPSDFSVFPNSPIFTPHVLSLDLSLALIVFWPVCNTPSVPKKTLRSSSVDAPHRFFPKLLSSEASSLYRATAYCWYSFSLALIFKSISSIILKKHDSSYHTLRGINFRRLFMCCCFMHIAPLDNMTMIGLDEGLLPVKLQFTGYPLQLGGFR